VPKRRSKDEVEPMMQPAIALMWKMIRLLRLLPGVRLAHRWARRARQTLEFCAAWALKIGDSVRIGLTVGPQFLDAVDAGRGSFAVTRGRHQVDSGLLIPHPKTAVILGVGQSNIANEGDPNGLYVPGSGVYNFNFLDGRCYAAQDPLLGATGDRGNFLTRLGDLLVRKGVYDRVLLVSIGHGGTYASDWQPGGRVNLRLMMTLELLRSAGLAITHVIWQQGEAEGVAHGDSGAWARSFNATVDAIRLRGVSAPIYVAQCTVCCSGVNENVRAAQRDVVNFAKGILAGPDIDSISLDDRWDGCHLSTVGLQKAAELWFATITSAKSLARPIYFLMSLWGAQYRSYFVDYCLPSLLSPNNLKLLQATAGHKFLICATEDDWHELQEHPIIAELARYVEPAFIPITLPEDSSEAGKFRHMTSTHRLLTEIAHRDRALACQIMPDAMYSDGTIDTILRHAATGAHAVLAVALRMAEEELFTELRGAGLVPARSSPQQAQQIILRPESIVGLAVRSLYYDNLSYDWDRDDFAYWPCFCLWRVPGKDEFLVHSAYFAYILLDFATIERHDVHSFEVASIENSWLSDNFPDPARVRVLQDSDDAMVLSWTSQPKPLPAPQRRRILRIPLVSALWKGFRLRRMWAAHVAACDVQKAHNFRYPIRWHVGRFDWAWQATEARANRIMTLFMGDVYDELGERSSIGPWMPILALWWAGLRLAVRWAPVSDRVSLAVRVNLARLRVVCRALIGDKQEIAHIRQRLVALLVRRSRP
jgi:hypothetical protein